MNHIDIQCAILDAADTLTAVHMLAVSKQLYNLRNESVRLRLADDTGYYMEELGFTAIYEFQTSLESPKHASSARVVNGCLEIYPISAVLDITKISIISLDSTYMNTWYARVHDMEHVAVLNKFKTNKPTIYYYKAHNGKKSKPGTTAPSFLRNATLCANVKYITLLEKGHFYFNDNYQIATEPLTLSEYHKYIHAAAFE